MTDLSPDARKLLQAGRTVFEPDAHELEAARVALLARLDSGSGAPDAGSAAKQKLGLKHIEDALASGVFKVAVATMVAISVIGYAVWPRPAPTPTLRRAPPLAAAPASVPAPAEATPLVAAPAPTSDPAPAAAPVTRAPLVAAPTKRGAAPAAADEVPTARPRVAKASRRVERNRKYQQPQPASAEVEPQPMAASPALTAPQPTAATLAQAPEPARGAGETLALELQLLRRARAALETGRTQLALQLSDQYQAEFAHGALQEEQLALRARALCSLGRLDAGRAIAERLAERAPRSPHLKRLEEACRAQPRE